MTAISLVKMTTMVDWRRETKQRSLGGHCGPAGKQPTRFLSGRRFQAPHAVPDRHGGEKKQRLRLLARRVSLCNPLAEILMQGGMGSASPQRFPKALDLLTRLRRHGGRYDFRGDDFVHEGKAAEHAEVTAAVRGPVHGTPELGLEFINLWHPIGSEQLRQLLTGRIRDLQPALARNSTIGHEGLTFEGQPAHAGEQHPRRADFPRLSLTGIRCGFYNFLPIGRWRRPEPLADNGFRS